MSFQILFGKCKQLSRIEKKLDQLLVKVQAMADHLDRLENAVSEVETAGASIIELLNGIAQELRDLKEGSAEEVEALAVRLEQKAEAFKAAVFENTDTEDDEPTDPEEPTDPV